MKNTRLSLEILPQPDDSTCGPTCLQAIYRFFGDSISLEQVITETRSLEDGGTLAVFLGYHALQRGYGAIIYTYNLHVFDPSWFSKGGVNIAERLQRQMEYKTNPKLHVASHGYQEFLSHGGQLRFVTLTSSLIRGFLRRSVPILTGLSATYLYGSQREFGPSNDYDDIRGEPSGHFVVLSGYESGSRSVVVSDPLRPNPVSDAQNYLVSIDRVICAIMLGVLTHDANLLIILPKTSGKRWHGDHSHRRR
jgi:hypothetical protein